MYSFVAEGAALIILCIVIVCTRHPRQSVTTDERYFLTAMLLNILAILFDAACIIALEAGSSVPLSVHYFLNTVYFILCYLMISAYSFYIIQHILVRAEKPKVLNVMRAIILISCIADSFVALLNPFTGLVFSFDPAATYQRGPLWMLGYIQASFMIILILVCVIVHRDAADAVIKRFVPITAPILILLMALQFRYPLVLMNGMMGASVALVMFISLQSSSINTDSLTGLGNRTGFTAERDELIGRTSPSYIIIVILEHFDDFNSTYGYARGNDVIKAFSARLAKLVAGGSVYRIGSTTFVMAFKHDGSDESQRLKQVMEALPRSIEVHSQSYPISPRFIEYALIDDSIVPADVLERIDFAKKIMRQDGLRSFVFDESAKAALERKKWLTRYLVDSVKNERFEIYIQPLYCVEEDAFTRGEMLVRLKDPQGNFVPPEEFMTIAEDSGIANSIGRQTSKALVEFLAKSRTLPIKSVSFNLSLDQIANPDFLSAFDELLDSYDVQRNMVSFELTERMVISTNQTLASSVRRFIDSEHDLLLDDFGTGYSNFASMIDFPFRSIKIDKSLLYAAPSDSYHTMQTLIDLFHRNGNKVVVEGVETAEQAQAVIDCGCDYIQGFYYARPMPLDECAAFLQL